jgi:hypothetical protein
MTYGLNVLKRCVVLTSLLIGTAYSEQLPSKPFKVCPNPTKPTDYPCVALGPTATIANRTVVPDTKEQELAKLREENAELKKLLEIKQESKK